MDLITLVMRRVKKAILRLTERPVLARVTCYFVFGFIAATILVARQAAFDYVSGTQRGWGIAALCYILMMGLTLGVYTLFGMRYWYWGRGET